MSTHEYMFFVVAPCQHIPTYKFYIPFTGVLMFGNFNEMPTIILLINKKKERKRLSKMKKNQNNIALYSNYFFL